MTWLTQLLNLVYPQSCVACDMPLLAKEKQLCLNCRLDLPKTNYQYNVQNPVMQTFTGRCELKAAMAFYHFQKGGRVQHLLHLLKYKNKPEVGILLGELMGTDLKHSLFLKSVDAIIPVPLHSKKLKKRGYNQSVLIAQGLSNSSGLTLIENNLIRTQHSESQTRKNRFERWLNVNEVFSVKHPQTLAHKHVLLIDDVVTTGATLEACYNVLVKIENVSVSILTVAHAA